MIPADCRECWNPECIVTSERGDDVDWTEFGAPGERCPYFVPTVNALRPCPCCGLDMAMVDTIDCSDRRLSVFVWCQHCGTTTNTYDGVEDAVRAWNCGEVCSQ